MKKFYRIIYGFSFEKLNKDELITEIYNVIHNIIPICNRKVLILEDNLVSETVFENTIQIYKEEIKIKEKISTEKKYFFIHIEEFILDKSYLIEY